MTDNLRLISFQDIQNDIEEKLMWDAGMNRNYFDRPGRPRDVVFIKHLVMFVAQVYNKSQEQAADIYGYNRLNAHWAKKQMINALDYDKKKRKVILDLFQELDEKYKDNNLNLTERVMKYVENFKK